MKKYLTIVFFTCFLVAGFLLGSWAGVLKGYSKSSTPEQIPTDSSMPVINNLNSKEQVNILLIQVDRVDSKSPKLQSLWMIVDSPHTKDWLFLPINPMAGSATGTETYYSTFRLDSSNQIDPAFSALLQQNGYGVASDELRFLTFDREGLSNLIDKVADLEDQRSNSKQATVLRNFTAGQKVADAEQSSSSDDNQRTSNYWRLLCRSFSNPFQSVDLEEMMSFVEQNVRTNLTREQIFTAIRGYVNNPTPVFCSFPVIEQSGP